MDSPPLEDLWVEMCETKYCIIGRNRGRNVTRHGQRMPKHCSATVQNELVVKLTGCLCKVSCAS